MRSSGAVKHLTILTVAMTQSRDNLYFEWRLYRHSSSSSVAMQSCDATGLLVLWLVTLGGPLEPPGLPSSEGRQHRFVVIAGLSVTQSTQSDCLYGCCRPVERTSQHFAVVTLFAMLTRSCLQNHLA